MPKPKDKRLYWQKLEAALTDIINDFETEGCEGQGTVRISTINKARKLLGMEPLDDTTDDDPIDTCSLSP